MPYKDPEKERACGRRRYERITAEHLARSMCPRCGKARPAPDRTLCRHCGEKRRKAERARCAKAKAAGILYGGRDAERCRAFARDRSRRRDRARQDARTCTRCGTHPPVEGGTVCEPCHVARRNREREQYAARRAAGLCGRCGAPAPSDAACCDRCAGSAAKRSRKKAKNYPPYCTSLFSATASPGIACRFESSRLDCFVGAGSGISNSQWPLSEQARPRRSPTLHHLWTVSIETPSCSAASRVVNSPRARSC